MYSRTLLVDTVFAMMTEDRVSTNTFLNKAKYSTTFWDSNNYFKPILELYIKIVHYTVLFLPLSTSIYKLYRFVTFECKKDGRQKEMQKEF